MGLLHVIFIFPIILMFSNGVLGYYRQLDNAVEQTAVKAPAIETTAYLFPGLRRKYLPYTHQSPSAAWTVASDSSSYLRPGKESGTLNYRRGDIKLKRNGRGGRGGIGGNGPSLSIVNPLDVLRQRLLLEMARRRMRQSEDQIQANREFLKTIGKRFVEPHSRLGHVPFSVQKVDETDQVAREPIGLIQLPKDNDIEMPDADQQSWRELNGSTNKKKSNSEEEAVNLLKDALTTTDKEETICC